MKYIAGESLTLPLPRAIIHQNWICAIIFYKENQKNIQTDYTLGTLVIFPLIGLWARKSNGGNSDANGQVDITMACPF